MTSNKYICCTPPLGTSIRVFAEPQESSLSWYQLCYKQWATEMNRYNGDRSVCPHLRKSGRWWGASTTFCFQTAAFFSCPIHPRHLVMKGYTQNIDFICLSVTEIQMFKFVLLHPNCLDARYTTFLWYWIMTYSTMLFFILCKDSSYHYKWLSRMMIFPSFCAWCLNCASDSSFHKSLKQ